MKGVVFTEFMEMVEARFSLEIVERLIEESNLASLGIYTSVGTYDHQEMVTLVTNLSALVGMPVPDLLQEFGRHLFKQFVIKFPEFFDKTHSAFDFLPQVESYVHLEVKKLYPDAELPTFSCVFPRPDRLDMSYRSVRNLPDLAEGLILGCIEHFGETLEIKREALPGDPPGVLFSIFFLDQKK
jgi:hypothetical protein